MAINRLNANDSLDTMLKKMEELPEIVARLSARFSYSSFFTNRPRCQNERLYTGDDIIKIKYQIEQLVSEIQQIIKSNTSRPDNATIETDAKRVLYAAYTAILAPSRRNIQKLDDIATEVQGYSSIWKKMGIVLASVVGCLSGIIPGIVLTTGPSKILNFWAGAKTQGLSLSAQNFREKIMNTDRVKHARWDSLSPTSSKLFDDNQNLELETSIMP